MRMLRNPDGGVVGTNLNHPERWKYHTVQQVWNEWEMHILVLVSFALQVFMFLFSGIRKRNTSPVLSMLLWLAYASADSIAIFVLGNLSLHINGMHHGLTLFWAPFMLLHLGGQETITAFSMEDNMLWKRHLLTLVTQVGLAAYVVGKQWQGEHQLLAPMVLMFFSGTLKYAERTWALMRAAKARTEATVLKEISWNKSPDIADTVHHYVDSYLKGFYLLGDKVGYEQMVTQALARLDYCLAFLMGMASMRPRPEEYSLAQGSVLLIEEDRVHVCYKLAEIQLSLVYDYLYTKFGSYFMQFLQLVTFSSTFTALVLFVRAHHHHKGLFHSDDNRADVIVSYILLIGAVILEVLSILFAISSYYWEWGTLFRLFHPESRRQWSGKLGQQSFIGPCIKRRRAFDRNLVLYIMYLALVRIKGDTVTHVSVSLELKKLLLDKLVEVAGRTHPDNVWDSSKFTGQWAKLELRRSKRQGRSSSSSAALRKLLSESAEHPSFMSTVLAWHVATEMCFYRDEGTSRLSPILSRAPSRELSNYIMYLTSKHGIISGGEGLLLLENARDLIVGFLRSYKDEGALDLDDPSGAVITQIVTANKDTLDKNTQRQRPGVLQSPEPALFLAFQLEEELMKMNKASDRWGIIANVWMEMLCYMALHCGATFHAQRLSTGGEFITHVNVLIYDLGLPYSTYFPETDEEPSYRNLCSYL